jgi:hypothetical protein
MQNTNRQNTRSHLWNSYEDISNMEKVRRLMKASNFFDWQKKYDTSVMVEDNEALKIWLNLDNVEVALLTLWMTTKDERDMLHMTLEPVKEEPSEWLSQRDYTYFHKVARPEHVLNWLYTFLDVKGQGEVHWMYQVMKRTRFLSDKERTLRSEGQSDLIYMCLNHDLVENENKEDGASPNCVKANLRVRLPMSDVAEWIDCVLYVSTRKGSHDQTQNEILLTNPNATEDEDKTQRRFRRAFPSWNVTTWLTNIMTEKMTTKRLVEAYDDSNETDKSSDCDEIDDSSNETAVL